MAEHSGKAGGCTGEIGVRLQTTFGPTSFNENLLSFVEVKTERTRDEGFTFCGMVNPYGISVCGVLGLRSAPASSAYGQRRGGRAPPHLFHFRYNWLAFGVGLDVAFMTDHARLLGAEALRPAVRSARCRCLELRVAKANSWRPRGAPVG